MNPCCVLVVEDDDDIRETVAAAIEMFGHEAMQARDGQEALEVLEAATALPGLILLDLMMPRMDGVEFRRRQRADARLAAIPVVILSADTGLEARARELSVAAFYRKPIKLETLQSALELYCQSAPRPRE